MTESGELNIGRRLGPGCDSQKVGHVLEELDDSQCVCGTDDDVSIACLVGQRHFGTDLS